MFAKIKELFLLQSAIKSTKNLIGIQRPQPSTKASALCYIFCFKEVIQIFTQNL